MNHSRQPLAPLKESEITVASNQQPNTSEPHLPAVPTPATLTDTCQVPPSLWPRPSSSPLGPRLEMGGGRKARWQHSSQFRIPVYFCYLTNTNTGARPVFAHDLSPIPKEAKLSSCYSSSNKAQCPANAKERFNFRDQVDSYDGFTFHSVKQTYQCLPVQTEPAPNGHRAHAQQQWGNLGSSCRRRKHLSLPGSCQWPGTTRICQACFRGRRPAEY